MKKKQHAGCSERPTSSTFSYVARFRSVHFLVFFSHESDGGKRIDKTDDNIPASWPRLV